MRSTNEWKRERKEFLKPYSSPNDQRLKVRSNVLCVCVCTQNNRCSGFWAFGRLLIAVNASEQKLSQETLEGLKITGKLCALISCVL